MPLTEDQVAAVCEKLDRLIDLRVDREIDSVTVSQTQTTLRDQETALRVQIKASDEGRHEKAELAVNAIEPFARRRNSCP